MSQFFSGLRFRLLLMVVLACTPLLGLMLHAAWEDRRHQADVWKQRSQEMIRLAGQEETKIIGQTRQLLLALAESSQVRSGNRRDCKKLLDELYASYPHFANLGVIRTNGDFLASALGSAEPAKPADIERGAGRLVVKAAPAPAEPTNQADREYFRRTLETRAFTIGDFQVGRTNGRQAVNFGQPVFDASGQIQAVILAALELDWFNRFESEIQAQLPKGAAWTEINRNGTIVVRYPDPEKWIGKSFPDRSLLLTLFSQDQGAVAAPGSDGVPSFYAFSTMRSQIVPGNVVAVLGIPRRVLFADVDRRLTQNLAGLAVAVITTLALGWISSRYLVLHPVNALVKTSRRLAEGDLSARTGLRPRGGELGQLTRTFDQMAQTLERREVERHQAEEKLTEYSKNLQILSRRLVEAQETERRHIARELHDEIGQALTVAQLNLQAILHSPDTSVTTLAPRLRECLDVIERVLEQVHDISLDLRPSMLDDLGLEPALRWYTNRQASLVGLQAVLWADTLEQRLNPVIETSCFRVAQEALTNVVRHARAQSVTVELRQENGCLHLRVRDDGIGFDVAAVRKQAVRNASLGLLNMEERAVLAEGGLEYNSTPGKGTEVHAWFPLKWQPPPT